MYNFLEINLNKICKWCVSFFLFPAVMQWCVIVVLRVIISISIYNLAWCSTAPFCFSLQLVSLWFVPACSWSSSPFEWGGWEFFTQKQQQRIWLLCFVCPVRNVHFRQTFISHLWSTQLNHFDIKDTNSLEYFPCVHTIQFMEKCTSKYYY